MRNESTDAAIGFMREIVRRYDAGSDDVIQESKVDHELIPPHGGWRYPMRAHQSPGFRGEIQVKYFFPRESLDG